MSPINAISSIRGLLLLVALVSLSACGDDNQNSTFSPETGKHPDNWVLSGHKYNALTNGVESCFSCHGENGTGGVANIPCSQCHLGGPVSIHPLAWGSGIDNVTLNHGAYVNTNTGNSCATVYCHGVGGLGASGPACTICHI